VTQQLLVLVLYQQPGDSVPIWRSDKSSTLVAVRDKVDTRPLRLPLLDLLVHAPVLVQDLADDTQRVSVLDRVSQDILRLAASSSSSGDRISSLQVYDV
jgi:hypothetical protein